MTQIDASELAAVVGGKTKSFNYDPGMCTMVTAGGALGGGFVGEQIGKPFGLRNIGWFAGAGIGGGLSHHFSPACH